MKREYLIAIEESEIGFLSRISEDIITHKHRHRHRHTDTIYANYTTSISTPIPTLPSTHVRSHTPIQQLTHPRTHAPTHLVECLLQVLHTAV